MANCICQSSFCDEWLNSGMNLQPEINTWKNNESEQGFIKML